MRVIVASPVSPYQRPAKGSAVGDSPQAASIEARHSRSRVFRERFFARSVQDHNQDQHDEERAQNRLPHVAGSDIAGGVAAKGLYRDRAKP